MTSLCRRGETLSSCFICGAPTLVAIQRAPGRICIVQSGNLVGKSWSLSPAPKSCITLSFPKRTRTGSWSHGLRLRGASQDGMPCPDPVGLTSHRDCVFLLLPGMQNLVQHASRDIVQRREVSNGKVRLRCPFGSRFKFSAKFRSVTDVVRLPEWYQHLD